MDNLQTISTQKGVTFHFYGTKCYDIDIEPGVTSVVIGNFTDDFEKKDVDLRRPQKSFPDVTELCIEKDVDDIKISNRMFPNVKNVVSKNDDYLSGPMLIRRRRRRIVRTLLNTFCKKEGEVIDLKPINRIAGMAFDGCESTNVVNAGSVDIDVDAFFGSAFERKEPENGCVMADTILVRVDDTADEVILPANITAEAPRSNIENAKNIVINNIKQMDVAKWCTGVLTINDKKSFPIEGIIEIPWIKASEIRVTDENPNFCSVDGILYTKNMKTLVKCSSNKKGHVEIPEGVEVIEKSAFRFSMITSVKIPKTVEIIKYRAFQRCFNLREVMFDEGSVLERIDDNVFSDNRLLHEIELPESLLLIGSHSLSEIKKITVKGRTKGVIVSAIEHPSHFGADAHGYVEVIVNGKRMYIPKCMDCNNELIVSQLILDGEINDKVVRTMFSRAATVCTEQDTAMAIYKDFHGKEAEEYLRKEGYQYAKRLLDEDNEKGFCEFVSLGLLSRDALNELLDMAYKGEWLGGFVEETTIVSYLLNALNRCGDGYPKKEDEFCV